MFFSLAVDHRLGFYCLDNHRLQTSLPTECERKRSTGARVWLADRTRGISTESREKAVNVPAVDYK